MAERSVAIYGAGAVGGYLGARLLLSPHPPDVTLIGRPRLQEAVSARGLILHDGDGEHITHPAVTTETASVGPCDIVLLTVRTYDVAAAVPDLRELVGRDGTLIAFQNGVGTEEILAEILGRDRVIAGTLTVSAGMEGPGVITRYSASGGVALATMDGSPVPTPVVELFAATGLETVIVDDYRSLRWSKLLLNMLAAPVSAILDVDVDALMADPRLFRIEQLAFREATRVIDRQGIRVVALPGYPVPLARYVMRLPRPLAQRILGPRTARARGGRSPGMRAEMRRGRSEVGAFNGAIAGDAARLGLPAPVNAALAGLTLDLVADPERRDRFRSRPEELVAYLRGLGVRRI